MPAETRNYVASVSARLALPLADDITIGASAASSWQVSSLFPASFLRAENAPRHGESAHDPVHADDARPTDWTALAPQSAGLFIASGHGEAQHVSTLSADAVWKRVAEKTGGVTVASVMEADIVRLGELGLTRAKSRSIVAIAKAIDAGSFDLQCLRHMTDFEASACLKSLPDVGTWTADVYLMTCEGRQDIFPAGDIMLRPSRRSCPDQSRRPS
ncbi:hypothetical protein [Acetobacter syzygii]|uniref:hypothetical protein n=1 Tax=Acetobacter syzygii TaxID=146476 RepID=UPI0039E94025